MKVVIDTNVLRATIKKSNFEYFIYEAFKSEAFLWVVSTEILMEYEEKLTEFYSSYTAQLVLGVLENANNTVFTEPSFKWDLIIEDPDDNKFSDLAISSNAYLVTQDKHFKIFNKIQFPKLTVVSPEGSREIIKW